ncbi:MAG TPA: hypothetical protein VKJ65_01205, partial [Phycisphaerae bacterium]|nr:hypothetical protein [Phycisphaerae bacterium]
MKRILQEVCVQPCVGLENDIVAILKPKLSQLHTTIIGSFQKNREKRYTFQDQLPQLEVNFRKIESK